MGSIYSPDRYSSRGKFSRRKFEAECLAEYAEVFPVVCGDFSFYQFPTQDFWKQLFAETPDSLRFAFKVPEEITVTNWPSHARYGGRAGRANASFLDHRLFDREFAGPLEPYRDRVAGLIFEFGTIPKATFHAAEFIRRLEMFLSELPGTYRYSVEIRNPEYLSPIYFDTLAAHNVAHVFNAWTRMPELGLRSSFRGPSPRISRSSAPCCGPAGLTNKPSPSSSPIGPSRSPTRRRVGHSGRSSLEHAMPGNPLSCS